MANATAARERDYVALCGEGHQVDWLDGEVTPWADVTARLGVWALDMLEIRRVSHGSELPAPCTCIAVRVPSQQAAFPGMEAQ